MPNPNGRPKGSPNKTTSGMRDAILDAAYIRGEMIAGRFTEEDMQEVTGVTRYLLESTIDKDKAAFLGLFGKAMPMVVEGGDPKKPLVFKWDE